MIDYYPIVSIVIVVYNAAETIEQTLKSIISQTYQNKRIIIRDGGSTDGTLKIIKNYNQFIYSCVSKIDKGIYDAMNKSVESISGDYIYFLGADDVFFNNSSLENFIKKMDQTDKKHINTIYYGNVIYKNQNIVYGGKFSNLKFCLRNICHQSILYPRSVFNRYSYDLNYRYLADFVMNLNIKKDREYTFHYIPETLAIYNDLGTSGSNTDENFLKDRLKLIKVAFPFWIFTYAFIRFRLKEIFNG